MPLQVRQQATRQAVEQRQQPRPVGFLAESAGRRLFEVMGLVDDEVVVLGQEASSHLGIGQ